MNIINREIYKVLTTKVENVKPEQHEFMERLGYQIVTDDDDSIQGYITLLNPKTNRRLCISKDSSGPTGLFSPWRRIVLGIHNIKKVDFEGYLNKPTKPCVPRAKTRIDLYKEARWNLRWERNDLNDLTLKSRDLELELEKIEGRIERTQQRIAKAEATIAMLMKGGK